MSWTHSQHSQRPAVLTRTARCAIKSLSPTFKPLQEFCPGHDSPSSPHCTWQESCTHGSYSCRGLGYFWLCEEGGRSRAGRFSSSAAGEARAHFGNRFSRCGSVSSGTSCNNSENHLDD